ncbi:hypothetical protein SCP_1103570 [Sparassis crispa]|uniref:Uncharacterized protein n=1 Tax=Sparassis crispa TaxID=139825 RepID=A0A401GZU6_9APHY|nr:hypothetical protein SCP_1103570 [Sparassis crispa]GBE87680.1 hypothetical protein SCP_1103570 [Sparassis crispa]
MRMWSWDPARRWPLLTAKINWRHGGATRRDVRTCVWNSNWIPLSASVSCAMEAERRIRYEIRRRSEGWSEAG